MRTPSERRRAPNPARGFRPCGDDPSREGEGSGALARAFFGREGACGPARCCAPLGKKEGACGPVAVKALILRCAADAAGAFPAFRKRSFLPSREIPLSPASALTADPLLIAAWLVGLHAQPTAQGRKAMTTDIYQRVTDQIVAELEKGVRSWLKPWNAEHAAGRITRPLRANGIPYRGINVLMLWASATEHGFAAPLWLTYKQAQELGGQVRKGEKGSLVVYANTITRTETDEATGEEQERDIPFMKGYTVFNAEQVEGLPAHFYAMKAQPLEAVERIAAAERFFASVGADIREGGNQAFYPAFPKWRVV